MHHAVCYVGLALAQSELAQHFAAVDPDVHVQTHRDFGIAEARQLAARAATRPVRAEMHTFLVCTDTITHEAQNALLKLFEEPPATAQFYLVVPKRGLLLPTLQSRLFFIESTAVSPKTSQLFAEFQSNSLGQRLALVADLSKEKAGAQIEELVAGAESVARDTRDENLLRCVMFVREHIGRRGASTKMLLEDLALTLPQG